MTVRGLRIMQVVGTDVGGDWFFDQVTRLARRGHQVLAVLPGRGPLTARLEASGIATTVVPFKGSRPRDIPRVLRAELALTDLVRRFRPDVLHSHLLKAFLLCRVAGHLGGARAQVSQVPGTVHLQVPAFRWLDGLTVRLDDLVIGSSAAVAAQYARLGARRVAVNYYGCDVWRIDPTTPGEPFRAEYGIPAGAPCVGMVAHLYPTRLAAFRDVGVKGHEIFIEAARRIRLARPDAFFFVVGDEFVGDGSYRRALERRAESSGLGGSMIFTGHRRDVAAVMAAMDVVVNPALSESASYTMVEALLMERGVVASRVGGLPDTVQHGETGLLVPPGDPAALAEAITTLLDDPERRRRMGRTGRQRVLARFDVESTVGELERIYLDVLGGLAGG